MSANRNRLATGSASSLASGQGTSASPRPKQAALQPRDANAAPVTGIIGKQALKMLLPNPSQHVKARQHVPFTQSQKGARNITVETQDAEQDEQYDYDEEMFQEMEREEQQRSNMDDVTMEKRRGHVAEGLRSREQAYDEPQVKAEGEEEEGDDSDDDIEDLEDQDYIARSQVMHHQKSSYGQSQGTAGRGREGLRQEETSQTPELENEEHFEAEYNQDDNATSIGRDARNLDSNCQASEQGLGDAVQQAPAPTLAVHAQVQDADQRAQQAYQMS